ncbi:BTB/POZ domain-containing protein At1g21780 [Araneus ventricosus]|uniref:BTB/POZ domain-containing protein At1g21780 n=1 Tax=Araneus ventricosus TaxID=182803 RepID=A0A4Y2K4D1_ARAVE|nr:BTB/POZ domain-containing protein At1g21780 [Araneus ventricosus]
MACGSSRTGSPFTFTWTINNIYKQSVFYLDSPVFVADSIDKTKWRLGLHVAGWHRSTTGHLTCVLQREKDENGLGSIYIDFQISIVDETGAILRSVREERYRFGMNLACAGDTSYRVVKNLIQIKTFVENFEKYLPNNTLTIRCRMWKFGCTISRTDLCFARTILDIEKRCFVWSIEQVFFISPGQNRTIHVPPYNKGSSSLHLSLSLKQNCGEEIFSIEMYEVKNLKHLYCEISIINSEGKIIDCRANRIINVAFVNKKCQLFQAFIRKSKLIEDQKRLLTNGAMVLQCDFQLSFGVAFNQIENYREESSEIDVAADNEETATSSPLCHSSSSSNKVLEHLLNEGTLSDITFRAGTKSFLVHKNILSARSIVFKSMFLKDEMENKSKVVVLPNIDEITLRSLLLYIYTDVVEDLEFGNAMELYQAADKYQLTDLKNICRKFLMGNLCRSNIFQVLSFADIYQDSRMKKAAQDFISDLGNEFTSSDEWQGFKKRNLELAMETMEHIFSRKRMKTEN